MSSKSGEKMNISHHNHKKHWTSKAKAIGNKINPFLDNVSVFLSMLGILALLSLFLTLSHFHQDGQYIDYIGLM